MVGLRSPRRALPCCFAITREYPAHSGAARLVPPQQHWICATPFASRADEDARSPRDHRHVGDVARRIVRHAVTGLPRGLGENLACAAAARSPGGFDSARRHADHAGVVAGSVELRIERSAAHAGNVRARRHLVDVPRRASYAGIAGRVVLQAGRAPIARTGEHGLALGGRLREQRIEPGKERCTPSRTR